MLKIGDVLFCHTQAELVSPSGFYLCTPEDFNGKSYGFRIHKIKNGIAYTKIKLAIHSGRYTFLRIYAEKKGGFFESVNKYPLASEYGKLHFQLVPKNTKIKHLHPPI
jgi:hypothetical protein